MNCRTFHKKLEDYLQGGLDFSNRFAIERHAQQCISCGKDLADAVELRRMALDLKQVEAPADFESALLDKIGMYKAHSRFPGIRRFWVYGPEWLSWRNLMIASSGMAVLVLGILVSSRRTVLNPPPPSSMVFNQPEKVEEKVNHPLAAKAALDLPELSRAARNAQSDLGMLIKNGIAKIENKIQNVKARPVSFGIGESESVDAQKGPAPDILKLIATESGIRPMPMLPKMIWIQYRPASEEYFIQNVSH
jgi:hypothetical protein